ncbi:ornithine cyclodeaminase family protein [Haloplanus aerogenes]|uniref:Alanine dehydrogenase n=1 Tax=Haloplanus aerogenes TaxID=660522 RepID=A0A3M0DP46_9EURY|nr:ornithine cyclodeaminase family protein [Haloplanus aerogenes]AZH24673.1 ornithine cyclodeaminase family protein [Haloplanus aerogenes]RMB23668.1 alanine dehydrogenase [Haloplanus aerogenes]
METLLLDADVVASHTPMTAVVDAVETAFAAHARGDAVMPPKSYVDLPQYDGDFRSMPAYLQAADWDAAGVKWVNSHPNNRARYALPTVMGTMIYSDPETAFPLAIMDGTTLTTRRTGAAAAVATDHLAVRDASTLGLVGAGVQSHAQLDAILTVRPIETVVVADADADRAREFVEAVSDRVTARVGSIPEAAACDILSTVTPVEEPIVDADVVGEHTHVNAIGADAAGKHELADDLLAAAKIVVDDREQCTHSGEINVPYREGRLTDDDIHATLGEVVVGEATGRTDADGVTVFDSTGLAIQDVAAAHVAYERAAAAGAGVSFDLLGL